MNNRGVTLVELIVVMSVTIILVVALAFSYQGWQGRYKVESQTKTLYTDLMDARAEAVQRAATYMLDFPTAASYRVGNDTSGNGKIEEAEVLATFPTDRDTGTKLKRVDYTISWSSTPNIPLDKAQIVFDKRGLVWISDKTSALSPIPLLVPAPATVNLSSTANPDYDCIAITQTRMFMGQTPRDASNNPLPGCNAK